MGEEIGGFHPDRPKRFLAPNPPNLLHQVSRKRKAKSIEAVITAMTFIISILIYPPISRMVVVA
ncbi:hypothetical protein GCM10007415_02380 [Parapedobacter pyrenivorans]|uniref:Uncharacterized protein n=1 Tax=Parapedobacter pyrenivorans TaxID=1305674 RepID=A0A917HCF8_9SPHI|nr:hypothetical protein GCM10007415_02380 [Parapedobacter pyrenivorans]